MEELRKKFHVLEESLKDIPRQIATAPEGGSGHFRPLGGRRLHRNGKSTPADGL